jgi:hypothetical protein
MVWGILFDLLYSGDEFPSMDFHVHPVFRL